MVFSLPLFPILQTMYTLQKQSRLALFYFLLIAVLGVLLRLFQVVDFSFDYRNLVHTHSHIALLGWVYTAFIILIYHLYLKQASIEKKYIRLFWFTQLTVIGMLITFPFTGYGLCSILCSSLFIIASYFLSYLVFTHTPDFLKQTNSYKCIRMALWYMILSSLGPWSLGYIMQTLGNTSDWYRNAIYFYLHFQYNGWFIMGIFALLFYLFEQKNIQIPKRIFQSFLGLMNGGILATFAISLLWMQPPLWLYGISGLGALAQLVACGLILRSIGSIHALSKDGKGFKALAKWIVILYGIKLVLQALGTLPYFASMVSMNTDFIIGYIHWIFLGVISPALLLFLKQFNLIKLTKTDLYFYIVGFLLTEGFIFYKGIVVWANGSLFNSYFWWIAVVSALFGIAIFSIFIRQFSGFWAQKNSLK